MEDTKSKILKAALKLFEKKGYVGASVNDILKEAGVTKGSFYHYFQSKDDLLFLIHDEFIEYELQMANKVISCQKLTCKEKLRRLNLVVWDSLHKYKENFSIFFQESKYIENDKFTNIRLKREQFERCFTQVIDEGIKKGEFRKDIDSKLTAFGIFGMCAWGVHWYRPDGKLSIEEIAQEYFDMIFEGITI